MAHAIASFILMILILWPVKGQAVLELHGISWIENNRIQTPTGEKSIRTSIFGGGALYQFDPIRPGVSYGMNLGLGAAKAHTQNVTEDFVFSQTYLTTFYTYISAFYRWKLTDTSRVGLAFPVMTRMIDFQSPTPDVTPLDRVRTDYFLAPELELILNPKWILSQRILVPFHSTPGAVWMAGVTYGF